MKGRKQTAVSLMKMCFGCALSAVGFNMFLMPNELNAGGITGLSMVFVELTNFGSVGTLTAIINLPLFALAGLKVGRKFFTGSLLGMLFLAVFVDLFAVLPSIKTEPLIAALYGGVICGFGLGLVFSAGYSTGGSDIIVRLLKKKWPYIPIGVINIFFDLCVASLTGVVFADIARALYSGVAIFICGRVIDAVVYRFDYSIVALIISDSHEAVAEAIAKELNRGATFLHGEGAYTRSDKKVVLTAVKRQQITELKELVTEVDPKAFIIVQEAHQVLGDGFKHFTKDSL